jgi:hypothetical protein
LLHDYLADRVAGRIQLTTEGHRAYPNAVGLAFRHNVDFAQLVKSYAADPNGFSKKLDNHMAAIALHFLHYNFARPHKTLANPYPRTPAMASGIADHVWSLTEIIARAHAKLPTSAHENSPGLTAPVA